MRYSKLGNIFGLLSASAILLSISIVALWLDNKLIYYIHPRYVVFTISLVLLGLFTLIYDWWANKQENAAASWPIYATVVFCVFAVLLPPQTLSSRAALIRQQTSVQSNNIEISSFDSFTNDYSNFTIDEWEALLAKNPPPEQIIGKEARIQGFILINENRTYVSRFRLSCCSVDATPITVRIVNTEDLGLIDGEWYEVSGLFEQQDGEYVLSIDEAEEIEIPENPYVF